MMLLKDLVSRVHHLCLCSDIEFVTIQKKNKSWVVVEQRGWDKIVNSG